jgi:hypothetical protein
MRSGRSPLQNRVTPFGDVVAIAQRGLFIGNRGIIHDPATKTLLGRCWTTKAWLVCVLDYKGRHREVMGGRTWTELFFLDEAVALAAGHRPCFFCRRRDAEAFRAAWAKAKGGKTPLAPEIMPYCMRSGWTAPANEPMPYLVQRASGFCPVRLGDLRRDGPQGARRTDSDHSRACDRPKGSTI